MLKQTISRKTPIAILGVVALGLAGCGSNTSTPEKTSKTETPAANPAGGYKIAFRVDPNPPAGAKENAMHVTVEDSAGKSVSDAQVHVTLTMPPMPDKKMPEMKNGADLPWTGSDYSAPVQVTMAGGWKVEVEAKRGSEVLSKYETDIEAK